MPRALLRHAGGNATSERFQWYDLLHNSSGKAGSGNVGGGGGGAAGGAGAGGRGDGGLLA